MTTRNRHVVVSFKLGRKIMCSERKKVTKVNFSGHANDHSRGTDEEDDFAMQRGIEDAFALGLLD